jgi:hypothetical protein
MNSLKDGYDRQQCGHALDNDCESHLSCPGTRHRTTTVLTGIIVEQLSPRRCKQEEDIAKEAKSALPVRDLLRDKPDHDGPSQCDDERDRRCDLGTLYVAFRKPLLHAGRAN